MRPPSTLTITTVGASLGGGGTSLRDMRLGGQLRISASSCPTSCETRSMLLGEREGPPVMASAAATAWKL